MKRLKVWGLLLANTIYACSTGVSLLHSSGLQEASLAPNRFSLPRMRISELPRLRGREMNPDLTPGMVEAHVAELEGLLLEEEGAVLIGVFPTGGWLDDLPDCSVRFQQGFVGLRVGYLLRLISQSLRAPLVLHQERPRVHHAKGKGKGAPMPEKGRGKGKKGDGKGGKGGRPAAKAAAVPLIPGQAA